MATDHFASDSNKQIRQFAQSLEEYKRSVGESWRVIDKPSGPMIIWCNFICSNLVLPSQGYKIHVSLAACEWSILFELILPILIKNQVSFKIPSTLDQISNINSGAIGETQVGKIVTAYPVTTEQALNLAREIDRLFPYSRGPAIPSDITLRKGGAVSLRYGVIKIEKIILNSIGIPTDSLRKPEGDWVADIRHSDGSQADWAPLLPGEYFTPQTVDPAQEIVIEGRRFLPLLLLYTNHFGTVRLGLEVDSLDQIIIKSSRAGIGGDIRGFDACDRLVNEYVILCELAKVTDIAPRPIAISYGDPTTLIIEEIKGVSFDQLEREKRFPILLLLARALADLHEQGYVHGDIKLSNMLVTENSVRLIDFGTSGLVGSSDLPLVGTRNYIPPEGITMGATFARDIHALGVCVAHVILEQDPASLPGNSGRLVGLLHLAGSRKAASVVARLINPNPDSRPSADEASNLLEELSDEFKHPPLGSNATKSLMTDSHWYKRAAMEAGAATREFAKYDSTGCWWINNHFLSDYPCEGINLGAAGIILGLTSLDKAMGKDVFVNDINAGADWLATREPTQSAAGLFTGDAGVAVALALTAKRYSRPELLVRARTRLGAACAPSDENDLFSGAAGVILAASYISTILDEMWPLDLARPLARFLCDSIYMSHDIPVWAPSKTLQTDGESPFLGMAHGTAGIAMSLAIYGRHINDDKMVWLAADAFKRIYSNGLTDNRKTLLYRLNEDREPGAIVNWCHGTAGYLWGIIQAFDDHPIFAEEIDWAVAGLSEISEVLAVNTSYCHGLAGLSELWRMVSSISRHKKLSLHRRAMLAATMRLLSFRGDSNLLWLSDVPSVTTPDLWIGFLAPATALALESINFPGALLSAKWLKICSRK